MTNRCLRHPSTLLNLDYSLRHLRPDDVLVEHFVPAGPDVVGHASIGPWVVTPATDAGESSADAQVERVDDVSDERTGHSGRALLGEFPIVQHGRALVFRIEVRRSLQWICPLVAD